MSLQFASCIILIFSAILRCYSKQCTSITRAKDTDKAIVSG